MGRRIVVVGGSGFIGTRLVARLHAAGEEVWIADRAPSQEFSGLSKTCDVRDAESLRAACDGADVLVNLAAEHRDDVRPVSLYDEVNVGGAKNTCEVADRIGCKRIIFTSTVAVYGFSDGETTEDAPTNPFNDYGRTKLEAERVFQGWFEATPGACLTFVRPTVVFGEGNRGNVYNLLHQLARGPALMIGDGTNPKSMAYVENVAAFLQHALELPEGLHVYNYVDKPDFDMNALVATVRGVLSGDHRVGLRIPYRVAYSIGALFDAAAAITGRNFPLSRIRVQKFCSPSLFSAARVAESGFVPPVDLETALRRTIRYEFGGEHPQVEEGERPAATG